MHRILTLVLLLLPMLVSAQSLGTVNGEPIDTAEYRRRVERARAAWTQRLDPEEELGLRQSIWEQIVDEMILLQGAQRLGVAVDREAFERMQREADPNDDPRDIRNRWLDYVSDRVGDVLAPDARPTEEEMRELYARETVSASGMLATFGADLFGVTNVTITDAEIEAELAGRHDDDDAPKETRELRYVEIVPRPSAADTAATMRRLGELRSKLEGIRRPEDRAELHARWTRDHGDGQFLPDVDEGIAAIDLRLAEALRLATAGSIVGPLVVDGGPRLVEVLEADESGRLAVRVRHIFIAHDGTPASKESARRQAADLARRVRSGESFEELARQHSDDHTSADAGGDVGYVTEGTTLDALTTSVFAAAQGALLGPMESSAGYHVVQVLDRSSRRYRLRDWRLDVEASDGARAEAAALVERVRGALIAGEDPDAIARREGVAFLMSGPIERNQQAAESIRLGRFAYVGAAGDVSPVITLGRRLVVAQIASISDSAETERAVSRTAAYWRLYSSKGLDLLMERARALRARLPKGGTVASIARLDRELRLDTFGVEGHGPAYFHGESALIEAARTIALGEVSQPIRGENGVYLLEVTARSPFSEEDFLAVRDDAIESLARRRRFQAFMRWYAAERERAVMTGWPE